MKRLEKNTVQVPTNIIRSFGLNSSQYVILCSMLAFRWHKGSIKDIQDESGLGRNTICSNIEGLLEKNILFVARKSRPGVAVQYQVNDVEKWTPLNKNFTQYHICMQYYGTLKETETKTIKKQVDNTRQKTLNHCIKHNHLEVVKLLLKDPRVDPSANNNWAIRYTSGKGHAEIVKLLLKDPRVDPGAGNNLAIQKASAKGHTEIVKLLLKDPRVDPRSLSNYAIGLASEHGHTEVVKLLLKDPRVDPSDDDNWAIRRALEYGHTEIAELLKERGCEL